MNLLRQAAKALFAAADLFMRPLAGPRILIYHQVGVGLGRQMEVTRDHFAWHLRWLAANRRVVSLEDALLRWDAEESDDLVVLTFDDGYRDTYTTAFPILREHAMPFTVYLATQMLDDGHVHDSLGQTDPLTWTDIERMMASGLATIGAHTHTHRDLRIGTVTEIEEEISVSNAVIQCRLGVAPKHFAYPWGYWSKKSDRLVRETYESAVLGSAPVSRTQGNDRHMIYRFPIQNSDGRLWFRPRLRGGFVLEEELRRRLRGYVGP